MESSQHLTYVQYSLLNGNEVMSCDAEQGAGDGLGKAVPLLEGRI
jgi:hypothetical protein